MKIKRNSDKATIRSAAFSIGVDQLTDEKRRMAALEKEVLYLKDAMANSTKAAALDSERLAASISDLRCYVESSLSAVPRISE